MGVSWTEEQQKIIDLRGRSMLVSAAAGSGKTAVLVERMIRMVMDRECPMDIDRLLVVTFTNAAAAEMRERVGNAIEKALEEDPYNLHLQRQLTLVHNAKIMTIDSFCMDIIRNHFHKIDLEPGFRIGDEGELKLLREDVCEEVLESFYAAEDEKFLKFADSYSGAKSDERIKEMMLQLYDYSVSYPWPEEWLDSCGAQYEADTVRELEDKPWVTEFLRYLKVRVTDLAGRHKKLYAITQEADGPGMYEASIRDDLRQLEELAACSHLDEWSACISKIKFKMIGNARKYEGSEMKKQAVADGRDRMKKQIAELKKNYFSADMERQLELLHKTAAMVGMLVELTKVFAEKFREEKSKKNVMDFSDAEHYALKILVDPQTKEPTETAREYQEQFVEVMIDEYQDSNYVQEALLTAVSGLSSGRENMFMVGDVKQSIYRFRLARPELFMEKYHSFSTEEGKRQRIDLHRNFRSRGEVVDTVNDVFYHIMGKDLGNVEYDTESALYPGASYSACENPDCCRPELIVIPEETYEEDKKAAEARTVAQRIRKLVQEEEIPGISYQDITILLRSLSGWAESFQKVFDEEGIPLIVASRTGYFSAQEVQTVLSFLRVIDNPCQDIPLAAVLKSYLGGFSSEELACVKTAFPEKAFYQCVREFGDADGAGLAEKIPRAGQIQQKIKTFWKMLDDFRRRVPYTPIHQLLQEVLSETGYRDFVTALPAGEQRRANLDMLLEKAIAYENTSYHGLFHFVRYIDRLMTYNIDYGEAEIVSEQENAVRMMSIHKSKGLEFPVVFVCGMGKTFNMQDSRSLMIFHSEYGIGLKWFDSEKRVRSDTLIRQIFALETRKENLGEELRILYVALTRAREKLILTGCRKMQEEIVYPRLGEGEKLDFSTRFDAKCYWDWVLPALCTADGKYQTTVGDFGTRVVGELDKQKNFAEEREQIMEALSDVDTQVYEQVSRQLSWRYPHASEMVKKQKVSVSELKHRAMEEAETAFSETESASLFPQAEPVPYLPHFVQETAENTGALKGTAVHRFLECFDFAKLPEFADWQEGRLYLQQQIKALTERGRMTEEEAGLLDFYGLYQFFCTGVARRMQKSAAQGLLSKEKPFVMSVLASRVWPEMHTDSTVLVQGIIDVFWEEEDGIVLLDYKTDRVERPDQLTARYERQLLLYREALERNFGAQRVKEILIYSFRLKQFVPVGSEK